MEAYEHYLKGRLVAGQFRQSTTPEAAEQFRRAIALDPEFAQAHAGLADILAVMAQWRFAPAEKVLPEATAAANRALDLAPDLAEAHMGVAWSGGKPSQGKAKRPFSQSGAENPAPDQAFV